MLLQSTIYFLVNSCRIQHMMISELFWPKRTLELSICGPGLFCLYPATPLNTLLIITWSHPHSHPQKVSYRTTSILRIPLKKCKLKTSTPQFSKAVFSDVITRSVIYNNAYHNLSQIIKLVNFNESEE